REVLARLRDEMIGEERGAGNDRLHLGILAVEDAQRIALEPPAAVGIERTLARAEVLDQPLPVGAPRLRRTEGIDLEPYPPDPEPAPQARRERDQLRVHVGSGNADRLDVDLVELAVPALLRPLVTKHRSHAPELVPLAAQHSVGDERAHDAGGRLRTQGQALP